MTKAPDTSRISPTAHYTAYVWVRNGLSHEVFATSLGRRLYRALRPINAIYHRTTGRANLEMNLLTRHIIIDHLLEEAIAKQGVTQVIEVASGLSPRGFRFCQTHPTLTYVEGDLPGMIPVKRALLDQANLRGPNHHLCELNALVDDGPNSLQAVAAKHLDPHAPTALITEGLTSYFSTEDLKGMWRRFAQLLAAQAGGIYLSDLALDSESTPLSRFFQRCLGVFVRGGVFAHFSSPQDGEDTLQQLGFSHATLHHSNNFPQLPLPTAKGQLIRIIEAKRSCD